MKHRLINFCTVILMIIGLPEVQLQAQNIVNTSNLHEAVSAGDLNKVRELVESDLSLMESKDNEGYTPLMVACQSAKFDIAKYLIEKGANVNAKGPTGETPIFKIKKKDAYYDFIKYLIDKGADVNAKMSYANRNWTVLCDAVKRGSPKVVRLLIEHGANINIYDIEGTPLQMAIFNKKEEIAKVLIESNAKLQEFSFGNTELHLAAIKGCADLIPLLIGHGANVNALNEYSHTPLYYATTLGQRKTADALIAAGADKKAIIETNYGKPVQLTESLREGEAYLWCLGFDGYAVKTKNHLLVFNPFEIAGSSEAGLTNGNINPAELKEQKTTVFISHLPDFIVSEMLKSMPDANYILNAKPVIENDEKYYVAASNVSFSHGGIQVHTIKASSNGFLSGNGLGYLVETDSLKIFYPGLHVCKNDSSQMIIYRKEIDYLKTFGPIDIVILPINGRHISLDYEPYLYLIDQLSPKVIYLFSDELVNEEPKKCIKVLQARNIPIKYPEGGIAAGERFHYLRESIKK